MHNPSPILYVEDEESDVLLMQLALKRAGLQNPLKVAVTGVEAIEYLAGEGRFADRTEHPFPCVVLLDLKLPLRNGFEVLAWARQQPRFAQLPILMYSSSGTDFEVNRAREMGATDYVVKMADVNKIAQWLRDQVTPLCQAA